MEKITLWLSHMSFIAIIFCSRYSVAHIEEIATLKLNFDKYAIPHATFIINGNPVYAMIDTGSSFGFHLFDFQLSKIKSLKIVRSYTRTDITGKTQENIEYIANHLNLNGIQLINVTITPFKQWGWLLSDKSELPKNAVVGLGAFKNKQILLDYKSNLLTITENIDHNSLIKDGFKEFSFTISSDGLAIDVEQSGHKYHFILDTGATISLIWNERLKSHESISCLLIDPDMDNKECDATMLTIKSLDGNQEQFAAAIISGDIKHMGKIDGIIGNSYLKNKKIFIDLKNNKVFISNAHK